MAETFIEYSRRKDDHERRRKAAFDANFDDNGGSLTATEPSLRSDLTALLGKGISALGFPGGEREGYQYAKNSIMPLAEMTGVGAVTAAGDAVQADSMADLQMAALDFLPGPDAAAILAMPALSKVGGAADRVARSDKWLADQAANREHPIAENKLRIPVSEMSHRTEPANDMLEMSQISPEDLQRINATLIPAPYDRTAAGRNLTEINGTKLESPTPLVGGQDFGRSIEQQGPDRLVGKSAKSVIERQAAAARDAHARGRTPVLAPINMGWKAGDFSHEMSLPALEMTKTAPITDDSMALFDDAMNGITQPSDWFRWPGLKAAQKDPAKFEEWLYKNPGSARKELAYLMESKQFQDRGFPDMASIRKAITAEDQFNLPTGMSSAFFKLDPEGNVVHEPFHKRPDYSTGIQGDPLGKFAMPAPAELVFPDAVSRMRSNVEARGRDPWSLTDNNMMTGLERGKLVGPDRVSQDVTQQMVDDLLRWEELIKKGR